MVVNIIHLECNGIKMSRTYLVLELNTQIQRTKLNEKVVLLQNLIPVLIILKTVKGGKTSNVKRGECVVTNM